MLAVQLGPHVVAEADKCCPVAVTGQGLATGADTAACRGAVLQQAFYLNQRGISPEKQPWLAAMWSQLEKRKQERGKISAAGLCQVKSEQSGLFLHSL